MPELGVSPRLLFHAFPGPSRRFRGERRGIVAQGIAQIELMMRYGLLLTPENLTIPVNDAAVNREPPKQTFQQARACFTLVEDREELWRSTRLDEHGEPVSHVDLFGEFAIGLDPIRARELGAVPVIYFYTGGDSAHTRVSREVLFTLRELRSVAIALARLEAKARIEGRDTLDMDTLDAVGYVLHGDPIVRDRINAADERTARAAVDLLDTDRRPAWNLVDGIEAMLDLFQTADSYTRPGSLAYYQEREWRIAALFSSGLRSRRLVVESNREAKLPTWVDELRDSLRSVDGDFFTKERLDQSTILHGTTDEAFFDFVEEIVCPADAASEVAEMLQRQQGQRGMRRTVGNGGPVVFVRSTG